MSSFILCQWDNCTSPAEVKCSCDFFVCAVHQRDHVSSRPEIPHQQVLIILNLTQQDSSGLQTTDDALKQRVEALVSQIVLKRDKKVEHLLMRIREIEEKCSQEIESLLAGRYNLARILKEIREKELVPLVSEDPLAYSVGQLIVNKHFDCVDGLIEQISPLAREEPIDSADRASQTSSLRREDLQIESQAGIQVGPFKREMLDIEAQRNIEISPLRRGELSIEPQIQKISIEETTPNTQFSLQNQLRKHKGYIQSIAVSSCGKIFASAGDDKKIKL